MKESRSPTRSRNFIFVFPVKAEPTLKLYKASFLLLLPPFEPLLSQGRRQPLPEGAIPHFLPVREAGRCPAEGESGLSVLPRRSRARPHLSSKQPPVTLPRHAQLMLGPICAGDCGGVQSPGQIFPAAIATSSPQGPLPQTRASRPGRGHCHLCKCQALCSDSSFAGRSQAETRFIFRARPFPRRQDPS